MHSTGFAGRLRSLDEAGLFPHYPLITTTRKAQTLALTNRVTLDGLSELSAKQVADLPIDQIALLYEDAAAFKDLAASHTAKVAEALKLRYSEKATAARAASGKESGAVTLQDGDYSIKADLPKKVEWDSNALATLRATIAKEWGDNPADFIDTKYTVPEKKFTAWPKSIAKLFEPARTVSVGTATFKIERKES